MPRLKKNDKALDAKLGALRSDLDALKDDAKNLVSEGQDFAQDRARAAIRTAEAVAERAYRLAEETATNVSDNAEAWTNDNLGSVRDTVRSRPFQAIWLTLGIGFVVGALFGRR